MREPLACLAIYRVKRGPIWTIPEKKTWTNAFLAPLSLTHQGLKKNAPDRYNDDPNASEPAIASIDSFCLLHPKLGPAEGAVSYLDALIGK